MTVSEVLAKVRELKPTVQTDEILIRYINEIEGMAQTEVMRLDAVDVVQYTAEDMDKELLIGKPHHKMYLYYVMAMVDFGDGEYKKYQNGLQMANSTFDEWAKWWQRTYGTGCSRQYNVFLSAYGIAVKHGYAGSEEEWLLSLVGPQGPAGPVGPVGPRGQDGTVAFEELTEAQVEMLRGPAGKDGEPGKDGYTPIKGVDYFDGEPGENGADGYTPVKGVDYFDGQPGEDGVSPTVSVAAITGGTRVSITDAGGTKTFDVMNGKDGAAGTGSGDMLASMYDPQGKRLDIFAYVDEKVGDIDEDVTADEVTFADGETFQQKYDSGELTGPAGSDGEAGSDGVGIQSVVQTTTSAADGGTNVITVTKTDGSTSTFSVKNGSKGSTGETGPAGADGAPGAPATINGVTVLTIEVDENLTITQNGSVLKIGLGKVPETSNSTVVALSAAGWTQESDGEYSQTVTVPFMTAGAKVVNIDVEKTGADKAADAEAAEGFAVISGATDPVQMDGYMKFFAYEVPTVNVPVKVGVS